MTNYNEVDDEVTIDSDVAGLLRYRVNGLKKFSEKLARDYEDMSASDYAFQMGKMYSRLCEIENIIVEESGMNNNVDRV